MFLFIFDVQNYYFLLILPKKYVFIFFIDKLLLFLKKNTKYENERI